MKSKSVLIILSILIMSILIGSCSPTEIDSSKIDKKEVIDSLIENGDLKIRVAALKGPTTIGMVKLLDKYRHMGLDMDDKFHMYNTADEIVAGLSKKEIDVAAIPANLAASLYNKTEGEIKVAAINTLGVLYIVENGNSIQNPKDLSGKTIYSVGKGTTPEGVLKVFTEGYGIEDLNIEYKSEASEIGGILNSKRGTIAMLPEPFVTAIQKKNENIRTVFNMNTEWTELNDGDLLVTGVLVVREEFLEENEEMFKEFLSAYEKSIKYTMTNVEETAKLVEEIGIVAEGIGEEAIPKINIVYIDGKDMEKYLNNYLLTLYEFNEKLVGGKLPDEDFYYKK